MTLRITAAELARDLGSVLEHVEHGAEVIIERDDHSPVAVLKKAQTGGRDIDECIALAKAYEARLGYAPAPDADFASDVTAGIEAHTETIRDVWDA
ncbi:MAG: hypothetical protein KDC27_16800 [Acidobacteria bacterium]|nr:hypothetical protein [Acidobacteriota bacterium]